jgi:hypothetical protein
MLAVMRDTRKSHACWQRPGLIYPYGALGLRDSLIRPPLILRQRAACRNLPRS